MAETIYIIGGGAIGKALAVSLMSAGKHCVLVRATQDDGDPVTESITVRMSNGSNITKNIETYPLNHFNAFNGIVVITAKSYGNHKIATSLRSRINAPIVLLQNGLGVERYFAECAYPHILRCVLFTTSQVIDGVVMLKSVAPSPIGVIAGSGLTKTVQMLNSPMFPFIETNDLMKHVWRKAIANVVFNSICPLIDVDNGIFHRNEEALKLAMHLIDECVDVATGSGIALSRDELMSTVLMISKASDGQEISTLQDIRAGRPTEIDTLNFEIARLADNLGISKAVTTTLALGQMIKLKSASHRR